MHELFYDKASNNYQDNDMTQHTFGLLETEQSSVLKGTSGRTSCISQTVDHRFSNVNSDYVPSSYLQSPRGSEMTVPQRESALRSF